MIEVPNFSAGDFGKAAKDYAGFRKGFPESFFARLKEEGVGLAGQDILDLGTGTGTLARGFARSGARVTGLDVSASMLEEARELCAREGVTVDLLLGGAEAVPAEAGRFDVVTAGQCWHWFDGPAAARECARLLRPGGRLVIAHWSYLPVDGNAAKRTEELILEFNPAWNLAGLDGRYECWREPMESAGFDGVRSFCYEEDSPYTHEEWRGRVRACNGVLALKDEARIREFDLALAEELRRSFPEQPLRIPHRAFAIQGCRR